MKKWLLVMILFVLAILQSHQVAQAETAEWKKKLADLPEARIGASTGVVDGNIYVIGEVLIIKDIQIKLICMIPA
ncbi:hypothetical protein BsIDN1_49370 [Bacillus safensis]|uniref:Uncharacterized protein n=1 Tax=Bacillus safensis TaxID=561879 RepID=A0A5S9MHP3_BACIA|nr:hypothetical protein BsIDN1_49370 [Bacillus safensis]